MLLAPTRFSGATLQRGSARGLNDKLMSGISPLPHIRSITLGFIVFSATSIGAPPDSYSFDQGQAFLKTYCQTCHQGKSPAGGFDLKEVGATASLQSDAPRWTGLVKRLNNGEMPPKGAPA